MHMQQNTLSNTLGTRRANMCRSEFRTHNNNNRSLWARRRPRPRCVAVATYLHDGVEGGVGADGEVSARDVVADGGGQHAERHAELHVVSSQLVQLQHALKGLARGTHVRSETGTGTRTGTRIGSRTVTRSGTGIKTRTGTGIRTRTGTGPPAP